MRFREFFSQQVYSWSSAAGNEMLSITWGGILGVLFSFLIVGGITRISLIALNSYHERHKIEAKTIASIRKMLYVGMLILLVLLCLLSLGFNPGWRFSDVVSVTVRDGLILGLTYVVARIADKMISSRLLEEFDSQTDSDIYKAQYGKKSQSNITRVVRAAMLIVVGIVLTRVLNLQPLQITDTISISLAQVLTVILIIMIMRLLLWIVINIILYGWYKAQQIDLGKQYAYNQLLSYVIYFIAVIFILQYLQIDLTLLLAGAAALLVGIGIALQQVFSDFFGGLVILFERSVEVGDFLDIGPERGVVKKIGLRASVLETPDKMDIIVPNSQLVNSRVANLSSTRTMTRFDVNVGVAYGSNTDQVKTLLIEAATNNKDILNTPKPYVRLTNFGDNSLDFQLLFYSDRLQRMEDVKSDLRFEIDRLFNEHQISIPFPQRRIHIQKPTDLPE